MLMTTLISTYPASGLPSASLPSEAGNDGGAAPLPCGTHCECDCISASRGALGSEFLIFSQSLSGSMWPTTERYLGTCWSCSCSRSPLNVALCKGTVSRGHNELEIWGRCCVQRCEGSCKAGDWLNKAKQGQGALLESFFSALARMPVDSSQSRPGTVSAVVDDYAASCMQ